MCKEFIDNLEEIAIESESLSRKQEEMLEQFPDDDYHDVATLEAEEPDADFHYPLVHDVVVRVATGNLSPTAARLELMRRAERFGVVLVGQPFYGHTHWCWRAVKK